MKTKVILLINIYYINNLKLKKPKLLGNVKNNMLIILMKLSILGKIKIICKQILILTKDSNLEKKTVIRF